MSAKAGMVPYFLNFCDFAMSAMAGMVLHFEFIKFYYGCYGRYNINPLFLVDLYLNNNLLLLLYGRR